MERRWSSEGSGGDGRRGNEEKRRRGEAREAEAEPKEEFVVPIHRLIHPHGLTPLYLQSASTKQHLERENSMLLSRCGTKSWMANTCRC